MTIFFVVTVPSITGSQETTEPLKAPCCWFTATPQVGDVWVVDVLGQSAHLLFVFNLPDYICSVGSKSTGRCLYVKFFFKTDL